MVNDIVEIHDATPKMTVKNNGLAVRIQNNYLDIE